MFKQGAMLILTAVIALQASAALAQLSQSRTFKVSVTLPAVVGLNINADSSSMPGITQNRPSWPAMEQRVIRNKKPVTLRTITVL